MPQEGGQVRVTVAIRTTLPASTVTFSDQPGCSYNKRDALPTGVFIRGYRENEAEGKTNTETISPPTLKGEAKLP